MEIFSNFINKISNIREKTTDEKINQSAASNSQENTTLSNIYTNGLSQVNSDLPITYTKIGEIAIPGLKDKASVFKLANGQKVIIAPRKGQTSISTCFNAGSLNEKEDINGISHFVEHNLFNGSKNIKPKELHKRFTELGGIGNAGTSFNITGYCITDLQLIKENSLEEAIMLNAMETQFPEFPSDMLEKEKEIVKSEIDMNKDIPEDNAFTCVLKNLFNIKRNDNLILGTKEDINALTKDKVLDYYNTWYTPDNTVTCIVGDVNVDETINLVSKYFNKPLDLSKANQRYYESLEYNDKPVREDIILPNAVSAGIYMGFAIPEGTSVEDKDKIKTMISLLKSPNSGLSKALDKYGISINIDNIKMQNKSDGASAIIFKVSAEEEKAEEVIKIIYEELTHLANNPPSPLELENIKKTEIDNINNISELNFTLNETLANIGLSNDYNYFENTRKNINNITPQDISDTAKKFLDLNKNSICVSHANTATKESINQNYISTVNKQKVSFGASYNPKAALTEEINKIKSFKLANNIETITIPHQIGTKSFIEAEFNTDELNSVSSPAFMILSEILNRGSSYTDYNTFENIQSSRNMSVDFSVGVDGLKVNAKFNDEDINVVTSLLKEVLMSPNFSQAEFDRAKQIVKSSILSENISAENKLNQEIFSSLEKYASKEEKLKQLDELTLADIQNLYSKILSTSQVSAALCAPLDDKPYLQDIFNSELSLNLPVFKPYTKQKSPSYNIYSPNTEPKIITAAQEQSQAEIIQAYTYKESKNIDDIAKINLLNNILDDRLFFDLREDKELAYIVNSYNIEEKDTKAVVLNIHTTTDSKDPKEGSPDNARKSLEGFERNVNLLKNENVTEKELENAKIKYKTQILNSLETGKDKTERFLSDKSTPYDIKYAEELFDAIDRISVEDIKAAAGYVFQNPPITSITASQKTLDELNQQ